MPAYSIDISNAAGTRYGSGPVATATTWRHTRRLSQAGQIAFSAPATDARLSIVQLRRYAECYAPLAGVGRVSAGSGIIDRIDIDVDNRELRVSGHDLLRELGMRSVSFRKLTGGVGVPISLTEALDKVLTDCNSQADPDWTLDATTYASVGDTTNGSPTVSNVTNIANFSGREGGPIYGSGIPDGTTISSISGTTITLSANATATASDVELSRSLIYHEFAGESVLQAFIKVAELSGTHFRLGDDREIVWLYTARPASGIRAVTHVDPIAAETNAAICLITDLTYLRDSSDVISHIHPWGGGSGAQRLGLANLNHNDPDPDPLATTRTAPDGYTLDLENLVIRRDAAETDYGYSVRHVTFNDITPAVDPDDTGYDDALVAARNQLFDVAFEYLRTHSYPLESYRLSVTKLDSAVLPGQTIRVVYRGIVGTLDEVTGDIGHYRWVDIDADLLVLEATTELDERGIRTPGLVVATIDRWPPDDRQLLARLMQRIAADQAHSSTASYAETAGTMTDGVTLSTAQTITGAKTLTGDTFLNGGQRIKRTTVSDVDYTALLTDTLIAYTSLTAAREVTLPAAGTAGTGRLFIVKDEAGAAATHTITITPSGAETIDGGASVAITTNYGLAGVYSTGSGWGLS